MGFDRGGGGGSLHDFVVALMLDADDIVLMDDSQEGLHRHMEALEDFCTQRGLTVNLGKTKVMIFQYIAEGNAGHSDHFWWSSLHCSYQDNSLEFVHEGKKVRL